MRTTIQAIVALALLCLSAMSIAEFVPTPGTDCSNPDPKEYDYNGPPLWQEREDRKLNEVYRDLLAKPRKADDPLMRTR